MHRLPRLNLSRDLWASSSSSSSSASANNDAAAAAAAPDDDDDDNQHDSQSQPTLVSSSSSLVTQQSFQPPPFRTNLTPNRRSLLPAYPSFERNTNRNQEEHLLRPHIPRKRVSILIIFFLLFFSFME
jgi:hypothetical protein